MNSIFFARPKTGKRFRFYKEILEKVASIPIAFKTTIVIRLLITKEAYWSAQLFSLAPYGLNKRREFHSKNRICYH